MPLKLKLSIIFTLFVGLIYGQHKDTLFSNKFAIEIAPLAFIDAMTGPSYQIATEIRIHKNIALCLEDGGYFGLNGHDWITEQFTSGRLSDMKGYMFKAEGKIYDNLEYIMRL